MASGRSRPAERALGGSASSDRSHGSLASGRPGAWRGPASRRPIERLPGALQVSALPGVGGLAAHAPRPLFFFSLPFFHLLLYLIVYPNRLQN
jgi:hypothetical protein